MYCMFSRTEGNWANGRINADEDDDDKVCRDEEDAEEGENLASAAAPVADAAAPDDPGDLMLDPMAAMAAK